MTNNNYRWYILYPIYFDSNRTLKEGRRVPKEFTTVQPTALDLYKAASNLGYLSHLEANKKHPKEPGVFGRVRIQPPNEQISSIPLLFYIFISSFLEYQLCTDIGKILPGIASENKSKQNDTSKKSSAKQTSSSTTTATKGTAGSAAASSTNAPQISIRRKEKKKKK